jgi:hypothetical protein
LPELLYLTRGFAQCGTTTHEKRRLSMATSYITIQDRSTTLEIGGDIDHEFDEFDAPDLDSSENAVLMFLVNPTVTNGPVTLELTLNGQVVVDQAFAAGIDRAWVEIVGGNRLQVQDNELIATLSATEGAVTVSDVVMLYQTV